MVKSRSFSLWSLRKQRWNPSCQVLLPMAPATQAALGTTRCSTMVCMSSAATGQAVVALQRAELKVMRSWFSMGFSWDFHGIFMGFSWDFHGIFMVLDKKNMGKMMDSTDFLKGFWIVIGKTRLNNDPPPINITPHKQQNVTCLMRIKSSTARNKARTITKQGKHLESEHLRKK